jgi:mannose-6-phosphate isomerase
MNLYPLILEPSYKDYLWGGNRIPALLDRPLPPGIYAESWELSDRPEGMSGVTNGPLKGLTLAEVLTRFGPDLLGGGTHTTRFPLLVKLIDARERLSIQVHPDDASARQGMGEAKTEAWHILAAQPGARVYAGLKEGVDASALQAAIKDHRAESCLNAIPVTTGDTIFIPGGRVHAIGEGLLILEVQQNSNTTYRVYDWGRVDKDGKARDLHLDQALRVIRWHDEAPVKISPCPVAEAPESGVTLLVACPYFRLEQIELTGEYPVEHDGSSFHALFTSGTPLEVRVGSDPVLIPRGRTCLIPAHSSRYTLVPCAQRNQVLRISVPRRA